jgi:hypothetical protein
MVPLHSVLPDLAAREVRFVRIGIAPAGSPNANLLPDEYAFVEYYCDDLGCDCRRVYFEVLAKEQPGKVFASINFGWERARFYRRRMPWDQDSAKDIIIGVMDPINAQSEFADYFLQIFRQFVVDEQYRMRLRRHHQFFREAIARQRA